MLMKYENYNPYLFTYFCVGGKKLDQTPYTPTTKSLSSAYPPNDVFNSYRYSHSSQSLNSTVTSPIDLKTVMNFPPSSIPTCKVPVDSYGSQSMTTNTQQNHPSIMSPSTSVARPSFEHIHPYLPKHWIWSRNLFYPHLTNNNHLSALYANHSGAFSGSELSSSMSNKTESLNSNSPAQVTEINSDDSLDSHDTDKVKLKLYFSL
jgi:hypothetical protein